ncbi:uncharacterized protein BDV17DRAFT_281562 [Aspergillus undulatus]|uniref:uncharacterized protein n=1 Tax=Aspergillus undulatus TaxID=1810928 RepID=UPI003CCCB1E4
MGLFNIKIQDDDFYAQVGEDSVVTIEKDNKTIRVEGASKVFHYEQSEIEEALLEAGGVMPLYTRFGNAVFRQLTKPKRKQPHLDGIDKTNELSCSYRRGYVACLNCRARKVRCVLGSEPPCAKCRREHRDCLFQKQERTPGGKRREAPRWARQGDADADSSRRDSVAEQGGPRTDDNPGEHSPAPAPAPADESPLTDPMMSTIFTRPSDALNVLFDAARQVQLPPGLQGADPGVPGQGLISGPETSTDNLVSDSGQITVAALSQPSDEVLDLWDKCRFVRQGWFTAQEAVTYLDLLYRYLAPLSPVLTDDYRDHKNHFHLIVEEPMLCCTLLTISSRYFILPGAGGVSRSHFIHQRLWQYCELLIRRIIFGQEKHSTAKTRIVGSIESLMLISDWHPRSVHFPPETEGWDGELISPAYDRRNRLHTNGDVPLIRWREDVFEPARRSERMSWMLLGAATSLAYELGIFDGTGSNELRLKARCNRAARLLYVYVTQMAVKMGCSSLLPDNLSIPDSVPSDTVSAIGPQWWTCMRLWIELTRLMKTASAMFFQSMPYTKQQLGSGQYIILLQHFAPSLERWLEQHNAATGFTNPLSSIILIEYHHLKACTSALSIQAVVQRAVSQSITEFRNPAEGIDSCILSQDHTFIRNVVSSSRSVLEIATSMAGNGQLRYAPLRTLICITSSSIFLLKAISLGARHADLQTSLDTLDRCIVALRRSGTDDMDFSLRYATLLEKHVARFKANFVLPGRGRSNMMTGSREIGLLDTHQHQPTPTAFSNTEHVPNETLGLPTTTGALAQQTNSNWMQQALPGATGLDQLPPEEDWWARPFDPNIAPFSSHGGVGDGVSLGLELDSLDFLWNLPMLVEHGDGGMPT